MKNLQKPEIIIFCKGEKSVIYYFLFYFFFQSCVSAQDENGFKNGVTPENQSQNLTDSDGDTISDIDEGKVSNADSDSDTIPDYLDSDSDNDTIPDSVEAGDSNPGTPPVDCDSDGIPNFRDIDSDNNGIFDPMEGAGDRDGDGIHDFCDNDNDGDGIPDIIEVGNDPANPSDSNNNGISDYMEGGNTIFQSEVCDQIDNDGDGRVDENCLCSPGQKQPCYDGPPATRGKGACMDGVQTCEGEEEFSSWSECTGSVKPSQEDCYDMIDNDCDGLIDCMDPESCEPCHENCYDYVDNDFDGSIDCNDPDCPPCTEICDDGLDNDSDHLIDCDDPDCTCIVEVELNLNGDCITASCPPEAPYPVGCSITMGGRDSRGCVAASNSSPVVYFQEGDCCGSGIVTGTLYCSSVPGDGLNSSNCTINKSRPSYPSTPSGCTPTDCDDD